MTPRYLRVAIAIASAAGCGGAAGESVVPISSRAGGTSAEPIASVMPRDVASGERVEAGVTQADPTEGSGACRCSWEVKTQGIARVCRVGEQGHTGVPCVRKRRPKFPDVILGPLLPPDLPW